MDLAGRGVEAADEPGCVARVPDIAALVGYQTVRTRVGCGKRVFGDVGGLRIEPTERVRSLAGVPDRSVGCDGRVVWKRADRHRPLIDADVDARTGLRRRRRVCHRAQADDGENLVSGWGGLWHERHRTPCYGHVARGAAERRAPAEARSAEA